MTQANPHPKKAATCEQITQAAERIFAEKGYRAMTLREVTAEAGVNLAAVNYHFGCKRDLMVAVLRARMEPVNTERLRRLYAHIEQHAPQPVPLAEIFDCLFRPIFETARSSKGDVCFTEIIGRAIVEPAEFMTSMHKELFADLVQVFLGELKRSCPELSESEIGFRFYLAVSSMIGVMTDKSRLGNFTAGKFSSTDVDTIVEQLVAYTVAGFGNTTAHQLK